MPKLKVRITITSDKTSFDQIVATYIIEGQSPLAAMTPFADTAKRLEYLEPVIPPEEDWDADPDA